MERICCFLFIFSFLLLSCNVAEKKVPVVTFSETKTNSSASLRGLFVVDENIVWASGSEGTVLLSKNGGESWETVSVAEAASNDFRSIHAWDEKCALVFGILGPEFAYKTEDGGENWEVVYQDTTKGLFFNSLKFADKKTGLAVSDPINSQFFVLKTDNGGESWNRISTLPASEKGEANFAASNTCIEFLPTGQAWIASGGTQARVLFSKDFGDSWEVVKTPMIRGLSSSGIFSVSFASENAGMVVGGIYDQPELNTNSAAYTFDGGTTWLPAVTMPKEYRSCVQQVTNVSGCFSFALGKTGCDVSLDNGMNWNFINTESYYTFRAIPGKLEGFAAGSDGRIAKVFFDWE